MFSTEEIYPDPSKVAELQATSPPELHVQAESAGTMLIFYNIIWKHMTFELMTFWRWYYVTIICRGQSESSWGIFINIYDPEASNCFYWYNYSGDYRNTKGKIDLKSAKFYLSLSQVSEQLPTQSSWFDTAHGQNDKFFSHIFKCSASKTRPKKKAKIVISQW